MRTRLPGAIPPAVRLSHEATDTRIRRAGAAFALPVPVLAESLKFTVVGIDCEACAPPIVRALKAIPGLPYVRVYDARGRFVGAETGGSWDKIVKLVEKAQSGS